MRRRQILCVDDHAILRESLVMLLGLRIPDIGLTEAGTLAEALAQLQDRSDIELVLLDLDLPDCSGLDTLDRVRAAAPQVPVVVLSGHDDHDKVIAAIDRGAAGYLCKTADAGRLVSAVERVVRGGVEVPAHTSSCHALGMAFSRAILGRPEPPDAVGQELVLSTRQRDVLRLLIDGKPNKQISRELAISEATVKTHLQAVFRRLDVINRTQAVLAVARLGLTL